MDVAQREIQKVKNGRFILLPVSDQTRGHYTFFVAPAWEKYLKQLMEVSQQ
jgi:homoserine O-acetyltransferase